MGRPASHAEKIAEHDGARPSPQLLGRLRQADHMWRPAWASSPLPAQRALSPAQRPLRPEDGGLGCRAATWNRAGRGRRRGSQQGASHQRSHAPCSRVSKERGPRSGLGKFLAPFTNTQEGMSRLLQPEEQPPPCPAGFALWLGTRQVTSLECSSPGLLVPISKPRQVWWLSSEARPGGQAWGGAEAWHASGTPDATEPRPRPSPFLIVPP